MSVDKLQEKIRRTKNPSVIDLSAAQIPPHLIEQEGSFSKAYWRFGCELLAGLKGIVPAVRFSYGTFSLLDDGVTLLTNLVEKANELGFYVIVDAVESLSPQAAQLAAQRMLEMPCDGILLSSYIGSDGLKPYVKGLKDSEKALFVVIRTANKTASELQDLITGSRLMHMAAADIVSRYGESVVARNGYSQIAVVGAASAADSLRNLRSKYKNMFLLMDGYDYPNANAKNCSYGFDKLGHGAAACAGQSITGAWQETDEQAFVAAAVEAAERMKKNLLRYITIL